MPTFASDSDGAELARTVLAGDRRALARAMTVVERGDQADQLIEVIHPATGSAAVIGVTGSPGAGKSTLIDALTACWRAAGRRVGVLAVDPSSPFTTGALLGDRIRLHRHDDDDGVFVRSLASRGALGGLARAVPGALAVLDAAGFDRILVETVGVGQSELAIVDYTDLTVLACVPGVGDETQMMKSGLMEIPDVVVITHGDDQRARTHAATMRRMLRGPADSHTAPPVLITEAGTGRGIDELAAALDRRVEQSYESTEPHVRRRARLRQLVTSAALAQVDEIVRRRQAGQDRLEHLLDEIVATRMTPGQAAAELAASLLGWES